MQGLRLGQGEDGRQYQRQQPEEGNQGWANQIAVDASPDAHQRASGLKPGWRAATEFAIRRPLSALSLFMAAIS